MNSELAEQVLQVIRRGQPKAAFATDVASTIHPELDKRAMELVLREVGSQVKVLVADHAPPDRHLDTADLRGMAWILSEDTETEALEAEAHWNTCMRAFLGTHRCQ